MNKILTVIIPAYNVEKYLNKVLSTYVNSNVLNDIEVLIVNDGSKDNTVKIAQKYVMDYPQSFKLIDKENGGHGSTLNKGICEASGKYIRVIDGDDWVDTSEFNKYVESLKKIDADAVYTPFNRVNESSGKIEKKSISTEYFKLGSVCIDDLNAETFESFYALHSLTFNKKVLKQIPKISEKMFYVDQEYIMYALLYIKKVVFLEYTVYQYRVGNSEQSMAIDNQKKNVWMLEKVTFNILDFLHKNENKLSQNVKKIYELRIANLIHNVIHIYVYIGDKKSKQEIADIVEKIKYDEGISSKIKGFEFKFLKNFMNFYSILVIVEKLYRLFK